MSARMTQDPTFTNCSSKQADQYAKHRSWFAPQLIQHILAHDAQPNGKLETVLYVGCGPGNSTRDLAGFFSRAIGIDPSRQVTMVARKSGGTTKDGNPIDDLQGNAEVHRGVQDSSLDLLTAAMSTHWFDVKQIWRIAARVVNPGGIVALFNIFRMCRPPSRPYGEAIQLILLKLDFVTLGIHLMLGNKEVTSGYRSLEMP